jgi:non-ribosomal peptide synthetase component E (peptide arylation enzyme)
MPDPVLGEKACLFVQLRPGATLTLQEVQDYLAERKVAKLKWPERVEPVEAMPMTPTRKIIKGVLVAGLAGR